MLPNSFELSKYGKGTNHVSGQRRSVKGLNVRGVSIASKGDHQMTTLKCCTVG